jgi:hypothetical protein
MGRRRRMGFELRFAVGPQTAASSSRSPRARSHTAQAGSSKPISDRLF